MAMQAWGFPAPPVEEVRNLAQAVWTTQVYNLLDVPVGVVPVGRVTREDLTKPWKGLEASGAGLEGHADVVAACRRVLRRPTVATRCPSSRLLAVGL